MARILSFSEYWINYNVNKRKVDLDFFTTFRFPRADAAKGRDWHVAELIQVFYKSRSPNRAFICNGRIINVTPVWFRSPEDMMEKTAKADGFQTPQIMFDTFKKMHGDRMQKEMINLIFIQQLGIRRKNLECIFENKPQTCYTCVGCVDVLQCLLNKLDYKVTKKGAKELIRILNEEISSKRRIK